MENFQNTSLTAGMILISVIAMKFAHDSVVAVNKMAEEIQIMFVKS